jgi:hypothetical protein
MVENFDGGDFRELPADVPPLRDNSGDFEAPSHLDVLRDGRKTIIIGDPEGDRDFTHRQGDNPLGYLGTCGTGGRMLVNRIEV